MVPGPVLFARYAYPPNALGYCGPADPGGLLGAAAGGDLNELAARAAAFTGGWPYLQLIAASNGIADPLDERVVDAYWVGSALLDAVPPADLARTGRGAAGTPAGAGPLSGPDPGSIDAAASVGAAHHSFHVFAVYPWLEVLRRGREHPALTVLDRCRIRWGTVEAVGDDTVRVRGRMLQFGDGGLEMGAEQVEQVRYRAAGVVTVEDLAPGDCVSMHWDWVCERLTPARRRRLEVTTARNLAAVNGRPGPRSGIDAGPGG
jgi:hypothetical protein